VALIAPALLLEGLAAQRRGSPAAITVDYPEEGSIFPPEITAPTFLWRDAAETAAVWEITILLGDGSQLHARSPGERLRIGETDPRCVSATNEPPKLTARQAAAHTWKPDPETWAAIRKHSVERPATIVIAGWSQGNAVRVSQGRVSIQVSKDPVGAPIFYRDVPLMPSELEKGLIKPLSPFAMPLIGWRLRNIGGPGSRLVLEGLPTCANCHSFSSDGKTKGLNTLGFMAQLSPDGQYAVTTLNEQVYVANFKDYRFLQVFYPTRGRKPGALTRQAAR
jgi:hypothetical protein